MPAAAAQTDDSAATVSQIPKAEDEATVSQIPKAEEEARQLACQSQVLRDVALTCTLSSVSCYGLNRCIIQAQATDGQPILLNCQQTLNINDDAARALLRDPDFLGSLIVHNGQYTKWHACGAAARLFDDIEMVVRDTSFPQ